MRRHRSDGPAGVPLAFRPVRSSCSSQPRTCAPGAGAFSATARSRPMFSSHRPACRPCSKRSRSTERLIGTAATQAIQRFRRWFASVLAFEIDESAPGRMVDRWAIMSVAELAYLGEELGIPVTQYASARDDDWSLILEAAKIPKLTLRRVRVLPTP